MLFMDSTLSIHQMWQAYYLLGAFFRCSGSRLCLGLSLVHLLQTPVWATTWDRVCSSVRGLCWCILMLLCFRLCLGLYLELSKRVKSGLHFELYLTHCLGYCLGFKFWVNGGAVEGINWRSACGDWGLN